MSKIWPSDVDEISADMLESVLPILRNLSLNQHPLVKSVARSMAVTAAKEYKEKPPLPIMVYLLAVATGEMSRLMNSDKEAYGEEVERDWQAARDHARGGS